MSTVVELPSTNDLPVGALSRLFKNTSTSYKFLFAAALLDALEDSGFTRARFNLDDLLSGMLLRAWYPKKVFHLSFGTQDRIDEALAKLELPENVTLTQRRIRARIT